MIMTAEEIKNMKILSGEPSEDQRFQILDMLQRGYTYGRNIPPGIEWEKEDSRAS